MKLTPSLPLKILLLLIGNMIVFSCVVQDELFTTRSAYYKRMGVTKTLGAESFFSHTDSLLSPIVHTLQKIEADTPFVERFMQSYGIPLWDNAYLQSDNEGVNFYIPLYDNRYPYIIQNVWIFCIVNDKMTYAPIRREDGVDDEHEFLFDLLSFLVFGEENSTGKVFRPHAQTREWISVTSCWDVYTGTENHVEYSYTMCSTKTYWADLTYLSANDQISGGGGTNVPISGGGGSGSSYVGEAKKIFKSDTMTQNNWNKIDTLLKVISKTCMGNTLINRIKSNLDTLRINIQITSNKSSSFNTGTNTMNINPKDMSSDVLLHELWHICQSQRYSATVFRNESTNMEIEARYAQFRYMQSIGIWENVYKKYLNMAQEWVAIMGLGLYINEKGEQLPDLLNKFNPYIELDLIPLLTQRDSSYSINFYNNQKGISTFTLYQEIVKNCYQ